MRRVIDGDRPSAHGAILGRALAAIAEAGREVDPTLPDTCATCAFRPGAFANTAAGTGLIAFNCAVGIDKAAFGCHHGMQHGEPTRLCAGYLASLVAPFHSVKRITAAMTEELDGLGDTDAVRSEFDTWLASFDPDGTRDVYEVGRAYERHRAALSRKPHP